MSAVHRPPGPGDRVRILNPAPSGIAYAWITNDVWLVGSSTPVGSLPVDVRRRYPGGGSHTYHLSLEEDPSFRISAFVHDLEFV